LYESELAALWGCRLAKLGAVTLFLIYGVALIIVARGTDPAPVDGITVKAVRWLVWIAGALSAFSAARNAGRIEGRIELVTLIRQRGLSAVSLGAVRPYAVGMRVARLVGLPALGLGLSAVALSPSMAVLLGRLMFVVLLGGFVVAVSTILALLTDLSLWLTPDRAGWTLVALLAVPDLARTVWPLTPSAPALFDWLLVGIRTATIS
jgi:hypothetical protein